MNVYLAGCPEDEGMAIVNAIRREPAEQASKPKTADMHGSPL